MVRRSVLFAPGDQPELMRKAPETGADTVVFEMSPPSARGSFTAATLPENASVPAKTLSIISIARKTARRLSVGDVMNYVL